MTLTSGMRAHMMIQKSKPERVDINRPIER